MFPVAWENEKIGTNKLNTSDLYSLSHPQAKELGACGESFLYWPLVKQTCNLRQANKKAFKIYPAVPAVKKFQSHYWHQERVKRHMTVSKEMSSKV